MKKCNHDFLLFSKGNNSGVECQDCGQKWVRNKKNKPNSKFGTISFLERIIHDKMEIPE